MKKLIAGVILLGLLGACSNKKAKIDPFASITQEVDSIRHKADSIHQEELPEGLSVLTESLGSWTKRQFQKADGIFFIGAAGIAVRACAPFLRGKTEDEILG